MIKKIDFKGLFACPWTCPIRNNKHNIETLRRIWILPIDTSLDSNGNPICVVKWDWINSRLNGRKVSISWLINHYCGEWKYFISNFLVILTIGFLHYQPNQEKDKWNQEQTKHHGLERKQIWNCWGFVCERKFFSKKVYGIVESLSLCIVVCVFMGNFPSDLEIMMRKEIL